MDPCHDEFEFLLWDKDNGQVRRNVVLGRGISYLMKRAEIKDFTSTFTLNDHFTPTYTSDLLMRLAATGKQMHHTDTNTLHRVRRYHPSELLFQPGTRFSVAHAIGLDQSSV
ncbi:MAG TPA: hypothetical protein PKM12_10025 [Marmoricola sp.]|nr:hypothetical protein [Marmoricola sp.]HNI70755.1 hypothetical protein [Marmoricola sp.]HNN49308.1 hypothetical protein [Marmoricola sp.]